MQLENINFIEHTLIEYCITSATEHATKHTPTKDVTNMARNLNISIISAASSNLTSSNSLGRTCKSRSLV